MRSDELFTAEHEQLSYCHGRLAVVAMSNGSVPALQATGMCKAQPQSDVKEDQPKRVVITQPLHGEHRPTVPDATTSLQSLQADPPLSGRTCQQSSQSPGSDSGAQVDNLVERRRRVQNKFRLREKAG